MDTLHIFSQDQQHDEIFIVGNKEGLLKLKEAVDKALESNNKVGSSLTFCKDGEGYYIFVVEEEGEKFWKEVDFPYTIDYIRDLKLTHPFDLLTETQKNIILSVMRGEKDVQ